ncbi:MAG: PLP-dependent aminotransferase family protein [Ardenticatenales bacterium]|nr:PLP-dependent aminotransferase family protein [Ardenticatenales bacterium]
MAKTASFLSVAGLNLDRQDETPLHRQLYEQLRELIWTGRLPPGSRLPPTRDLAQELGLSRSTVVEAIQQLASEGFVVGRQGAGTFVNSELPEAAFAPGRATVAPTTPQPVAPRLSQRGQRSLLGHASRTGAGLPFQPGLPETATFPFKIWRKLLNRRWQAPDYRALAYGDPAGYLPLREQIAQHVATSRGVHCTPAQVIITSGTQQAIGLALQLLTDPGDTVWLENPGYSGARHAMQGAGLDIVPVPVDEQGLVVDAGLERAPAARLAYVSPSHQYPAGGIMSLARRRQLLGWAAEQNAWILEDDYDSEYRYAGHPLASLQGLDQTGNVLYSGTFSKVLFPGLRLGYLIVPAGLESAFATARGHADRGSCQVTQQVLHDFMAAGHLARHIRRMRTLYMERQAVLVEALAEHCGQWIMTRPAPAGLHLVGWLPAGWDDAAVSARLAEAGIIAPALSGYSLTPLDRGGLVLGYAAVDEGTIRATVRRMGLLLRSG